METKESINKWHHNELSHMENKSIDILKERKELLREEVDVKIKNGIRKTNPDFEYESSDEYIRVSEKFLHNLLEEQIIGLEQQIMQLTANQKNREVDFQSTNELENGR